MRDMWRSGPNPTTRDFTAEVAENAENGKNMGIDSNHGFLF